MNEKYEIDDLIQTFDLLERTAIGISLEKFIGNRQRLRTDIKELVENSPQVNLERGTKTRNIVVERLGFSSDYTYRQLKKILLSNCSTELFYSVRHNQISLSQAVSLGELPPDKQAIHLSKPY